MQAHHTMTRRSRLHKHIVRLGLLLLVTGCAYYPDGTYYSSGYYGDGYYGDSYYGGGYYGGGYYASSGYYAPEYYNYSYRSYRPHHHWRHEHGGWHYSHYYPRMQDQAPSGGGG